MVSDTISSTATDTITALATQPGGAIGVVRVSGAKAIELTEKVFRGVGKKPLHEAKGNTLHYGVIVDKDGKEIDDVLVSVFRAPHSYTGEDSTEVSCHGSAYVLNQVVKALIDAGCRQGEYTQRAYLNGKMDLSQAEAVADLIAATNRASHQVALSQLKGHFSSELSKLRDQLLKMTSLLELELDFSDHEELEFADRGQLKALAETIHERISVLIKSFETGNALKRGVPVAIIGKTNVGKSTLLNKILGQKISITSRKAQTTRHRIVGIKTEGAYQEIYVDTPGLHIEEKRAINRLMNRAASSAIGDVDLIIFVVDGTHWNADDEMVLNKLRNAKAPVVLAINKVDNIKNKDDLLPFITELSSKFNFAHIVPISAQRGNNVHELEKIVRQSLREGVHHFPEDYVTDRSQRFMASEIIREKLMRFTGEELPYSVTVEIEQFKVNERGTYEINGLILVEREGQKKMVIGAGGQKIKTIGMEARADMERLFDNKVHLELWVKVKSGWADDERALRSLGYMDE